MFLSGHLAAVGRCTTISFGNVDDFIDYFPWKATTSTLAVGVSYNII
jgi:hypothetical protein